MQQFFLSTSSGYKVTKSSWPSQALHRRVVAVAGVCPDLGDTLSDYCYAEAPRIYRQAPEDHRKSLDRLVWLAELSDWFLQNHQTGEEE